MDDEEKQIFKDWVKDMGGPSYVSRITGYDRSNIWRYSEGKLRVPKILLSFMKLSEENANLKSENASLKRQVKND
ncbi:MAG: hypothetical protein NE328_17175 [Lentisphaeraceae bacterium]|nr:hypothetical protein [Lentisphaeraceae bacterium]